MAVPAQFWHYVGTVHESSLGKSGTALGQSVAVVGQWWDSWGDARTVGYSIGTVAVVLGHPGTKLGRTGTALAPLDSVLEHLGQRWYRLEPPWDSPGTDWDRAGVVLEQSGRCWYLLGRSSPCCERAAGGAGPGGGRAGQDVRGGGSCLWPRRHSGAGPPRGRASAWACAARTEPPRDTRGPARPGSGSVRGRAGLQSRPRAARSARPHSWPPPSPGLSANTGVQIKCPHPSSLPRKNTWLAQSSKRLLIKSIPSGFCTAYTNAPCDFPPRSIFLSAPRLETPSVRPHCRCGSPGMSPSIEVEPFHRQSSIEIANDPPSQKLVALKRCLLHCFYLEM